MNERAQLFFGAHLLGDVDAEAEYIGIRAGHFDELVAVGDNADVAVAVAELEPPLGLARLPDFAQIGSEGFAVPLGHVAAQVVASHLFHCCGRGFPRRAC